MKKVSIKLIQALSLTAIWLFLMVSIGRLTVSLLGDVKTIDQGVVFGGFALFVGFLMFASGHLLWDLLNESNNQNK